MMLGMADARGRVVIELRRIVAAQRRNDAREDDRQPVTACVDHAGIAQRRQQLGTTLDRLLPCPHRALQRGGDRRVLQPGSASGSRRGLSGLCARSVTIWWAISRATVRIVPSAGSRTEE